MTPFANQKEYKIVLKNCRVKEPVSQLDENQILNIMKALGTSTPIAIYFYILAKGDNFTQRECRKDLKLTDIQFQKGLETIKLKGLLKMRINSKGGYRYDLYSLV